MKFRWRIKGLLVLVTLAAVFLGLYRVSFKPANDERAAIRKLVRKWNVSITQERSGEPMMFEGLSWPEFIDPERCTGLSLRGAKPRRMPKALMSLKAMQRLRTLYVHLTPEIALAPLTSLPDLKELRLSGITTTEQLIALSGCPKVRILKISDLKCDRGVFEQLPRLPNLEKIRLGEFCINVETYDWLESQRIDIEHSGIVGTFQHKNFMHWGETYAALEMAKCGLTANLSFDSEQISWQISAISNDKFIPRPADSGWHFLSSLFRTGFDWRKLGGHKTKVTDTPQDPEGYIYDGIFNSYLTSILEIQSVVGYQFHVKWSCEPDVRGKFKLNGVLPVRRINVTVPYDDPEPEKRARNILKKVFPLADFDSPKQITTGRTTNKIFVFSRNPVD